jgi:hypothetical protein
MSNAEIWDNLSPFDSVGSGRYTLRILPEIFTPDG